MAQISFNLGDADLKTNSTATAYSPTRYFTMPAFTSINWAELTFVRQVNYGGNTTGTAALLSGAQAHDGFLLPPKAINTNMINAGSNAFRCSLKSSNSTPNRYYITSIVLTVDYNEPGGGGGGSAPNIGTFGLNTETLTAGEQVRLTLGACDSGISRDITVWYGNGFNTQKATVGAGYNSDYREILFTVPESWCGDIAPNANSFQLMFYVVAYYAGGVSAGNASKILTVTVPSSAKPSIGSLTPVRQANGVDSSITGYIQNYSGVKLTITGESGALGSTIVSRKITGAGFTSNVSPAIFSPLKTAGTLTFVAVVTDSRGRQSDPETITITVLPYTAPSGTNLSAYRSNGSGGADDEGAYAALKGKRVFSSLGGQNTATIKGCVFEKGTTPPSAASMTNMTDNVRLVLGGSLSIEKAYTVYIRIADKITSVTYVIEIPTALVGLHLLPGATGAGIGMYGAAGKLDSAWPIRSQGVDVMTNNTGRYIGYNFLDNADFSFPVNQRGVSGTISATGYFYDRWILRGGSVTINPGYLTIGPNATIEQQIESGYLAGRSVVLSVFKSDLSVLEITGSFPGTLGSNNTSAYPGGGVVDFYRAASGYVGIRIRPSAAVNVIRVKVEIGTKSTILHDVPEPYDVKLMRCQRYYVKYLTFPQFSYYAYTTTLAGQIILPTAMRTNPTILQPNVRIYHNGTIYDGTITGVTVRHNVLRLNGTLATSMPTTAGTGFFNDTMELSAEL